MPAIIGGIRDISAVRRPTRRVFETGLARHPREIVHVPRQSTVASCRQRPARYQQAQESAAKQRHGDRRPKRSAPAMRKRSDLFTIWFSGLEIALDAPEIGDQIVHVLVAIFTPFLESFDDNRLERSRYVWTDARRRYGILPQDRRDDVCRRGAGEGAAADQHFVQRRRERENVGAGIDRFALRLFGRKVMRRSKHHSPGCT